MARDSVEVRQALSRTQDAVESIFESEGTATGGQLGAALESLGNAIDALDESIGVCRRENPHSELRFVLDSTGLKICCTHSPPHCSPVNDAE